MFYNYIYLDPRKPGKYCYNNISLLYEPIYVGKGKSDRCLYHIKSKRVDNPIFKNKIKKILSDGYKLEDFIVKINFTENEELSYKYETNLIESIGSVFIDSINDGPLTNICLDNIPPKLKGKTYKEIYGDRAEEERKKRHLHQLSVGGYFKGHKHSETSKRKISESITGNKNPMWGKNHKEDTKNKIGKANKGKLSGDKNHKSKKFIIHNTIDNIYYLVTGKFNLFCEDMGISTSSLQKTLKTGKPISRGKTMGWVAYDNIHNLDDYHNIQIY